MFPQMCAAMGLDPTNTTTVDFSIVNRTYAYALDDIVLGDVADKIDFMWIDVCLHAPLRLQPVDRQMGRRVACYSRLYRAPHAGAVAAGRHAGRRGGRQAEPDDHDQQAARHGPEAAARRRLRHR
tara:strand:- start:1253 stop:1627 length:375 start_codon:yes stop_codon:yes gene_type:complete